MLGLDILMNLWGERKKAERLSMLEAESQRLHPRPFDYLHCLIYVSLLLRWNRDRDIQFWATWGVSFKRAGFIHRPFWRRGGMNLQLISLHLIQVGNSIVYQGLWLGLYYYIKKKCKTLPYVSIGNVKVQKSKADKNPHASYNTHNDKVPLR